MTFLEELIAYVQLDEADCARLRALHPKLEPHFTGIADRFYAAVLANPGAAGVLSGPAQVERLRCTLVDWMGSGLLGPYDDKWYEKRSRIGRRHVQIGLAQHYMFTAMNVVRTAYLELIEDKPTCTAANKLLDIELAIMLRHYQLDSEERTKERERRTQAARLTAMQTLSAGLAHEVRNPLNAARLQLELLERRLRRQIGEDPKLLEPTALANHEIQRLTGLLDDFQSFARPPELHLSSSDVVEICRHVCELENPLARRRSIELTFKEHAPILAQCDSGKLHQVVQNLVRNGLEAAKAGGHVGVELTNGEDKFHIHVTDDGPGIPSEVLPRIYEPFFSTKESGTGMGMAIVHSLVAIHDGKIDITTGPKGTLFDVTLPRRG